MSIMDSSEILYNKIFNLPQSHDEIKSLRRLTEQLQEIILQIKNLKMQGRHQQIQKKCYSNKKLVFISKLLKENYFKIYEKPAQMDEPSTIRVLQQSQLNKKESTPPPFLQHQHSSTGNLANSRYTQLSQIFRMSYPEYKLKNLIISMFFNMLVNQKMLSFINYLNIPLYIYMIILKAYINNQKILKEKNPNEKNAHEKNSLGNRDTQKCLKFIYQYVKITKQTIPKMFIHIIKHFLQHYHQKMQIQQIQLQKKERIRSCYSYIFEIATVILKKNLFLASKCGILSLLYHKCIQGALPINKVETTIEIIINFCIQQKSRNIIYSTIDLGKTFAIFTNVDMVQSIHEKLSIANKSKLDNLAIKDNITKIDELKSCAVMIQKYLSNWSTLIYFLQQGRTLKNFIISLKRKSDEELHILNDVIFKKIMKRCINYNRRKIIKSNNIFNIKSNYLILKSLLVLNFFYKHDQFKELIYGNSIMLDFKQNFIQILLEYFISNQQQYKNREVNKILINNIKNINYYKKINIDISKKRQQEDQKIINNNIQSYYTESLLPYEFSIQELQEYLIKMIEILDDQNSKQQVQSLLSLLNNRNLSQLSRQKLRLFQSGKLLEEDLLQFYLLGLRLSQQIKWLDKYLDIYKYLSSMLQHLRQTKSIIQIRQEIQDYIKIIFQRPQPKYFQYLNINVLDAIGRYFYSDNKIIEYLNGHISDINQAYKISRILLHIDYERHNNQSIQGPQKIYSQISKRGSKALILQIIEIIKYSCQQNDNRFLSQHLQILFTLIYNDDEDIVYSIIQLLQQFVNKSKQLQQYIPKIDIKKVKHWTKRVLYLFLHYQNSIPQKKQANNSTFLNDQLEKWQSGQNRKKIYYNFVMRELKKFTHDSILSKDYLNLNLDPSNYHKLIFLPWNIKINENYYPVFIEYKNLQDKLKLKIYVNIIILKQMIIQELFIGSHNYTKYIQVKHNFEKKKDDLKIKLSLEQIKKQHEIKGKQLYKFTVQRQETIFFITFQESIYRIQRININIPLTLDTYRPLSHPLNFINLLCRTSMGFQFLKKEKFIDHCLQIVKNDQQSFISKDQFKGALVCLGTLAASQFMLINEKLEIYDLMTKKISSKDHQVQQICLWIINILIKEHIIRGRTKKQFILIQTKRCGWICLPDISCSSIQRHNNNFKQRMEKNIKYIKDNLPQKLDSEIYRNLCIILNQSNKEDENANAKLNFTIQASKFDGKIAQNIIKYISVIDFPPKKIHQALHKLANYFCHQKFDADFPNGLLLP